MFISMKEQVGSFILCPVAIAKKLFQIQIPAGVPDVIKKVVYVYQDTGKETDQCTEEAFEDEVESQAESKGSNRVIS